MHAHDAAGATLPIVGPPRHAQRPRTARRRKLGQSGKRHAWCGPRESNAIVTGRTGLAADSIRAAIMSPPAVMAPAMGLAIAPGRDHGRLAARGAFSLILG